MAQENWDTLNSKKYLSSNSIDYLNRLVNISDTLNYKQAQRLGFEYHKELVTMKLHGDMNSYKSVFKSSGERVQPENILFMMQFNGTGLIGFNKQGRLAFKQANVKSDRSAEVEVFVETGENNTKIISKYLLEKEGENWKLDLLSTFTLEENILQQSLRRSPLRADKAAFINNYLTSPPSRTEFQYRVK